MVEFANGEADAEDPNLRFMSEQDKANWYWERVNDLQRDIAAFLTSFDEVFAKQAFETEDSLISWCLQRVNHDMRSEFRIGSSTGDERFASEFKLYLRQRFEAAQASELGKVYVADTLLDMLAQTVSISPEIRGVALKSVQRQFSLS